MPSIKSLLALDKLSKLSRIIQQCGGLRGFLYKTYRMDDAKLGTLVGEDKYGNKYYENKDYFYARNRWVEYADHVGMNYDASQVPSEWYGWLHYKTDLIPTKDPSRPKYPWMLDHEENLTGTTGAYVPYSTVPPKIQAWVPPKPSSK